MSSELLLTMAPGTAQITVVFRRRSGNALFDPTTPQLLCKDPTGTQTEPTLARQSEGIYKASVDFPTSGTWKLKGASLEPGELVSLVALVEIQADDF